MSQAIRTLTVERGIEPREFSLVAFAGAGPMHAPALAQELGIAEVIVPPNPGSLCATRDSHTLTGNLPNGVSPSGSDKFATLRQRFEDTYSARYGHSNRKLRWKP